MTGPCDLILPSPRSGSDRTSHAGLRRAPIACQFIRIPSPSFTDLKGSVPFTLHCAEQSLHTSLFHPHHRMAKGTIIPILLARKPRLEAKGARPNLEMRTSPASVLSLTRGLSLGVVESRTAPL